MEHRNFIMFCQQDWDVGIGTNARSLAKELSKSNQVLYVNLPLDINSLLSRFKQPDIKARLRIVLGQEQGLKKVGHTLWVYTPGVLSLSIISLAFYYPKSFQQLFTGSQHSQSSTIRWV
jgi:teichuronic acid biosynthesis glycosyltransferase TuaH